MKAITTAAVIVLGALAGASFSQVEIRVGDIPSEAGTELPYYTLADLNGIEVEPGPAGENRVWDFSEFIFPLITTDELIDPDDAPHAREFPNANRVVRSVEGGMGIGGNAVRYERLQQDGWNLLGFTIPEEAGLGVGIEFIEFPNPIRLLPLPAEYEDAWDFNGQMTVTVPAPDTLADVFDSVDVSITYEGEGEIDAWGTVHYPEGETEALRAYSNVSGLITAAGVRWLFRRRIVVPLDVEYPLERVHSFQWFAPDVGELASMSSRPGEENRHFEMAAQIRMRLIGDQVHFGEFARTGRLHRIFVAEVSVDGEQAPAGWEVGVFTPDGLLAGGGVWRGAGDIGFPAYGDDPETEAVEGFRAEDDLTFRLWDNEADEELECGAEFQDGPEVWTQDGRSEVVLAVGGGGRELIVALLEGWNIISINVSPGPEMFAEGEDRGPDIVMMMEQLRGEDGEHHLLLMKDELGRFYAPAFDFNGITFWNITEGYLVKVDRDVEARWSGEAIPSDADIPISASWNMIAYFPTYELDAGAPDFRALAPIIDHVIMAKDGAGRFLNPEFNFSNMLPWRPGQGYLINVDGDVILNYPDEER